MGITRIRICYADGTAEVRFLPDGTYLIGRGTGAIPLDDPNVSTRHAELEISAGSVVVRDLGSRNGSRDPAGNRLTGPYTMKPGELIRLGKCTISITTASLPAETQVMPTSGSDVDAKDRLALPPKTEKKRDPRPPGRVDSGQIFISHVAENSLTALRLALLLEQAGYSTWTYELDSIAGVPHLQTTLRAIEQSQVFALLISHECVNSHEVTTEITRAHDLRKVLIPLLYQISHEQLIQRRAEWGQRFPGTVGLDLSDIEMGVERLIKSLVQHHRVAAAHGGTPNTDRLRVLEHEIKRRELLHTPPPVSQGTGLTNASDLPPWLFAVLVKFAQLLRRLANALRA